MFNVVIEKELDINNDPLIIKEDINNIVQSIEEQLYNINVSYRNHVRKIKNNIKSLEGVSESTFVILEDDNVNDDNLIYYLTNVLEISLDCVIATLCESREFKPQLSTVNSLTDLLQIDHPNIKVCNQIIENCKELFNVYSEVNDKKLSSTAFYEILDESITRSVKRNESETITVEDFQENKIYNLVIENLDTLVDTDLASTYDNIKAFAASISEALAPGIMGAGAPAGAAAPAGPGRWARFLDYFIDNGSAARALGGLGIVSVTGYAVVKIASFGIDVIKYGFDWAKNFATSVEDVVTNPNIKAILKKLETAHNEKNPFSFNTIFDKKTPVFDVLTPNEVQILNNHIANIKNYDGAQLEVLTIQKVIANYGGELHGVSTESNVAVLMNAVAELTKKKQNLESQSTGLTTGVEAQRAALATTTKDLENANTTLNLINKATYDTRRELAEMAPKAETAKMLIENSGLIIGGVAGTIFILLLVGSYLLKKKTFSDNSLKTLKTVLILRKKIDDLRKTIIVIFPELTVQFAFIDSEVKKCEQDSTRKNDIVQAYQCSMKYFMGSYALVMYSTLLQFVKDGGNLNSLNRLSDVHGYKGFATLNTRQLIFKLNEFYSLMIEYDATMNDAFESIFYLMKKQILENRSSDNIIKQLPNNLALGRV